MKKQRNSSFLFTPKNINKSKTENNKYLHTQTKSQQLNDKQSAHLLLNDDAEDKPEVNTQILYQFAAISFLPLIALILHAFISNKLNASDIEEDNTQVPNPFSN